MLHVITQLHLTYFLLLSGAPEDGLALESVLGEKQCVASLTGGERGKKETIACNLIQRTSERADKADGGGGRNELKGNERPRESQSDRDRKDKKLSRKTIADVVPHEWPRAEIHSNMRLVRHPLELPKIVIVKDFPPCH